MPRFNPIRGVKPAAPPPAAPLNRHELIPRIVAASRRPCWPIVPALAGGFCYRDVFHNTNVGTRHPTEAAARAAWEATEDATGRKFAAELEQMADDQLRAQADYWLKPTPATPPPVADSTTATVTLKATIHTKRQCPIWIAQLTAKVPNKEFSRLNGIARAGGGRWSSFGPVDIHGFIFFDEAKAIAFQTLVNPPATTPAVPPPAPAPVTLPPPPPAPVAVPVAAAAPACETCPCETVAQPVAIRHTSHTVTLPAWRQRLRPVATP